MLSLLLAFVPGPRPVPHVAPIRYHIVQRTVSDLDLSAMGAGAQSVVMTVSAWVSVTVSDSVHVLVDSSSFDAGEFSAQLPPEMTASAKGVRFDAALAGGKPTAPMTPNPASLQAAQLAPAFDLLFAGLQSHHAGDAWADTTRTDTTVTGVGSATTRIAEWTAKAADGGALQFEAKWHGNTKVGMGGMQMEMQVVGSSHVVAVPGQLASSASSSGGGQASMNISGNTVPMKMTMEMTATRIP